MAFSPAFPELRFESGWLLDESVAELSGRALNDNAVAEITDRLPEFQAAWQTEGPRLLHSVTDEFGLSFVEADIKAFLLCGSLHSQSHPLLVNVKYYLTSLTATPAPLSEFVETVFHELLHILLQDRLVTWPTPVVQEFEKEDFEVIAHLHLMGLQKFAHEHVGSRADTLATWYGAMGENYGRAWALANDPHHQRRLLAEIRTHFDVCGLA